MIYLLCIWIQVDKDQVKKIKEEYVNESTFHLKVELKIKFSETEFETVTKIIDDSPLKTDFENGITVEKLAYHFSI